MRLELPCWLPILEQYTTIAGKSAGDGIVGQRHPVNQFPDESGRIYRGPVRVFAQSIY